LYFGIGKTLDVRLFFPGLISDVCIQNVALTPDQIATMAQQTTLIKRQKTRIPKGLIEKLLALLQHPSTDTASSAFNM
jgi:hypothetical protein